MSQPTGEITKKEFQGSCHCKFIQYTVKLPLVGTASRCNCTKCIKTGFTSLHIPEEDFALVSPASLNEIPDYQPVRKHIHRYFCNKCGVSVLSKGYYEDPTNNDKRVDFTSLNLVTLDQPQEDLDLRKWKIQYWDGRHDNWAGGPKDEPWEAGCI